MNDQQIRAAYHRKRLARHHADPATVVLNELGIQHGRYRADIAVINGSMTGYEIKSNEDSLRRLKLQIPGYNSVFDQVTIVAGSQHFQGVLSIVPVWWGIELATEGARGGIHVESTRRCALNPEVDDFAVCQLLWRGEAQEILAGIGVDKRLLRKKRSILYELLVDELSSRQLRRIVREKVMQRGNWRRP